MPGARTGKRSPIESALAALADALDDAGAPWMIIGGIAVIAHGVQRMTTDIDAVVQGDAIVLRTLLHVLERHDIAPRIEGAEDFARTNLVLLARHRPTEVDLDISLGWTSFEHAALAARERIAYGRVRAPMARVQDLLVFKSMAGRPRDVDDAVSLLTLYPQVAVADARARLAELAELADAPEVLHDFDAMVRTAARGARPGSATAPTAPRPDELARERATDRPSRTSASRSRPPSKPRTPSKRRRS